MTVQPAVERQRHEHLHRRPGHAGPGARPEKLVRLIARDDSRQTEAAESFVERGAWVSHLALTEATWVLNAVFGRSPDQIARAVEMLLRHQAITIQDSEVVASALDHFRKRPARGFADCMLLEIARKAGHLPLDTFDRSLSKLPDVEKI
jgi:predicted nucleic-acid-binding protein